MRSPWLLYLITGLISFLLHIAFFGGVASLAKNAPPKRATILEFAVIEPPPPPKPEPEPEPEPEPKPKKKPPPPKKKKARKLITPPKEPPPPAPNTDAGEEPVEKARPVFGLTLESTVAGKGGNFSMRVGNTVMKDPEKEYTPPQEVKAYKPVPIHQLDSAPKVLREAKMPYPQEAKAMEIEGKVVLSVEVLDDGSVGEVIILKGLGYGLDQASIQALKKFKFKPATKGGVNVPSIIQYSYLWVIEY